MEAKSKFKASKISLRYISLRGIFSPVASERAKTCRTHSITHIRIKPLCATTTISWVLMSMHKKNRWIAPSCLTKMISWFKTLSYNQWRQIRPEYLQMGESNNHKCESRILDLTWTDSRIWKTSMAGEDLRISIPVSRWIIRKWRRTNSSSTKIH